MKLSEKYRAIADLYAYLESRESDCQCADCHCEVIDNGDGIEIRESLYQELVASSSASSLLDAITTCGVELYRYDGAGNYLSDEWFSIPHH